MNISSATGARPPIAAQPPEALERGPDRDADADDRAPTAVRSAPAPGTGLRVDIKA
ncbi:hypothetical protein [Caulobacter sp.]|uniref:hypothetical protein n=1 Tax=Caulobacter sp. TaxID=78 RepID=UPI002B485EB7|nr:hypothetical protein [Caulobacter sp.]HJV40285.1 hypothetical protein [Caulobacter sp.]